MLTCFGSFGRRAILFGTLIALPLCWAAEATSRYNVLFIVADDFRVEPDPTVKLHTPTLDRLAAQSVNFDRAYCQQAVCGPSRASLLSGIRPDSTGIHENNVTVRKSRMPDLVTLPQLFKENGYRSVSIGKVFHHEEVETGGDVDKRPGDDPLSWSEAPWHHGTPYQQWFTQASADTLKKAQAEAAGTKRRIVRGPPYEAADQPDDAYPDGQIAQKAVETLRRLKGEPFFLAVGFRRPHLPLNCPQKYWDLYPENTIKLPANYQASEDVPAAALHDSYEVRSYAGMPAKGPLSDKDALNLIRGYRACVSYMDAQVGRVLAELDALDLAENTLVVFVSDHGYHLGENSLWTKMTNFEVCTRVPLMFRLPSKKSAGARSEALVELVDIYPTMAEVCGLSAPRYLEGISLAPLLNQPDLKWKDAVFSQFPRRNAGGVINGYSMRTAQHRFTEWTAPDGTVSRELYDLATDPANNTNLAARAENKDLVQTLASKLHAGWKSALPGATVK